MKWFKLFNICALCMALIFILCSCKNEKPTGSYESITPSQAKELIEKESEFVILDVRSEEEYNQGHIKGAVLIPHTDIGTAASERLKNKDELILVYCRTGRRSKLAAEELHNMGYTNVKEFGGINDWEYETEKN